MTVSTQNIPNSKIKTATYNNTEIYMYGPVDIRDTNNSKTTNNTNNKETTFITLLFITTKQEII